MKTPSLFGKLLFVFSVLMLLAFSIVAFVFSRNLREDFVQEATERARHGLAAVHWIMEQHHGFADERELDAWITGIGKRLHFRITCINDGRVMADSEVAFEGLVGLDDHGLRPEVRQAEREGFGTSIRYSRTVGKELLYAAMPVSGAGGMPGGVLRLAMPISDIQERYQRMIPRVYAFMVLAFCAVGLLAGLFIRQMSASIQALSRTAQQIGEGDYSRRIASVPGREFMPLMQAVNTMAGNIQEHINSLEDAKGELEALFNGMASGVMILGSEGRVESWNKALAEMFPDMGNARGQTILEVTMQPELRKLVEAMRTSPEGTSRMGSQFETRGRRMLQAVLVPFRTPKGVRKIVIVFHDITEIKRLERVRQDFMVNITHEIRTPVTSIQGYAETLLDNPEIDPGQRHSFLQTIHDNARHMSEMVTRLLSLARLDAETRNEMESVPLREQLLQAMRTLEQEAGKKGVEIVDAMPQTPMFVQATKAGLFELLVNLLENAVAYGPANSTVTVAAEAAKDAVLLRVTDQGEAIPGFYKERIFERFFRIDPAQKVEKGRYGLGLAICRQIVTSFGGSIWLESPQASGTGNVFCVSLKASSE
jgi:two-component system, OmpR family, phosphate regulon sensor histidine kinase PhoR